MASRCVSIDLQVLQTIDEWAKKLRTSKLGIEWADNIQESLKKRDLHDTFFNKKSHRFVELPNLSNPGSRAARRLSDHVPDYIAIALTVLEGRLYGRIYPSDYIFDLGRDCSEHVDSAWTTNDQIFYWVQQEILSYDRIECRGMVVKFFIHIAWVSIIVLLQLFIHFVILVLP